MSGQSEQVIIMKRTGFVTAWVGMLLTLFTGTALVQAQSDSNTNRLTVPFSDPSRPGTVNVSLFQGGITVRASTGRDVIVTSNGARVTNSRDQPSGKGAGLRRPITLVGDGDHLVAEAEREEGLGRTRDE